MQTVHVSSLLTPHDTRAIDEILLFWLGEPARDADALTSKFKRWYTEGATLDAMITARFGHLVVAALDGTLSHWATSMRGRLALVLLLDQFTRNIYRGTPRAYAGDEAALRLALEAIENGSYELFSHEQRLFLTMPLVHAEDLALQTRAVELARDIADTAPTSVREPWTMGWFRTQHYRGIIERFGRFPHRNAILGRASTLEERRFLEAAERTA